MQFTVSYLAEGEAEQRGAASLRSAQETGTTDKSVKEHPAQTRAACKTRRGRKNRGVGRDMGLGMRTDELLRDEGQ